MFSLGRILRTAAAGVLIAAVTLGEAGGQANKALDSISPAALADSLTRMLSGNVLGATVSATSHGSVLEVRYVVQDPKTFPGLKGGFEKLRLDTVSYYCRQVSLSLKRGVTIHFILSLPANFAITDFTFGASDCASVPLPQPADAKALAQMARDVADRENSATVRRTAPYPLNKAIARDGTVEVHIVFADRAEAEAVMIAIAVPRGPGYFCYSYGDLIRQGLKFHFNFALKDGTRPMGMGIKKSDC